MLALAVILAACTRRPSADLQLEDPRAKSDPSSDPAVQPDARIEAVCVHSFTVLLGESPSLGSPGIEQDFIARCIAGNQIKRSELGEEAWAKRAGCIERAQTGDQLGACDGRVPHAEPNPPVVSTGANGRMLCKRIFDMMFAENPDMAHVFGPAELEPLLEQCSTEIERARAEDPIKFDREAACMMAANKVADLEACSQD